MLKLPPSLCDVIQTLDVVTDRLNRLHTRLNNITIGSGDMSKSLYDANNNGKVDNADNSDKLGGITADKYALLTVVNNNISSLQDWVESQEYLSSFTETDPTVPNYAKSLTAFSVIKTSTDSLYEPKFSKNTAFNLNLGTTAGTVAEGNDPRIINGQTAFGWGNHSTQGYLTSYTETDPIWNAQKGNYLTTASAASTYSTLGHNHSFASLTSKPTTLSGYGITDAYPLIGNPSGFLTSFTETDPTVPSHVKSISTTNISNWNIAYGWGNHAGLYRPISYIPTWTEVTGKPSLYNQTEINNLLLGKVDKVSGKQLSTEDYTTQEKNDLASIKLIVGEGIQDGDAVVDTLSEMLKSFESFSEGVDIAALIDSKAAISSLAPVSFSGDYFDLINKPATADPNYHTHPFSQITDRPTTLLGYGITDAYPLTGNPSGFLTSFTETDPLSLHLTGGTVTGIVNIRNDVGTSLALKSIGTNGVRLDFENIGADAFAIRMPANSGDLVFDASGISEVLRLRSNRTADFYSTVSGANATANNHFVTLGQLNSQGYLTSFSETDPLSLHLTGGTMANTNKVTNLHADIWGGLQADFGGFVDGLNWLVGQDGTTGKARAVSAEQTRTFLGLTGTYLTIETDPLSLHLTGGTLNTQGAARAALTISGNDQSNTRIRFTNTGKDWALIQGQHNASNDGFSIYDATAGATRFSIAETTGYVSIQQIPTDSSSTTLLVNNAGVVSQRDISSFGYLTSYSETSTLQNVATRGNTYSGYLIANGGFYGTSAAWGINSVTGNNLSFRSNGIDGRMILREDGYLSIGTLSVGENRLVTANASGILDTRPSSDFLTSLTGAILNQTTLQPSSNFKIDGIGRITGTSTTTRLRNDAFIDFTNIAEDAYVDAQIIGNTLKLFGNNGSGLYVSPTGSVGINTTNLSSATNAKLVVNGHIALGSDLVPTIVSGTGNGGAIKIQSSGGDVNRFLQLGAISNDGTFYPSLSITNGAVDGGTKVKLNAYGLGTITGTPTSGAAWDASGNFIETLAATGTNFILNQTTLQPSSNFNIDGTGTVKKLDISYNASNISSLEVSSSGNFTLTAIGSSSYKPITYRGYNHTFQYDDLVTGLKTALTIKESTGNVGIGTTDPQTPLEIQRTENIERASYSDILTINAKATTLPFGGHGGGILFAGSNYINNGGKVKYARIGASINDNSVVSYGSDLFFDVSPLNDGLLERAVTIKYNKNVGIGTLTPQAKLHVKSPFSGVTQAALIEQGEFNQITLQVKNTNAYALSPLFQADNINSTVMVVMPDNGGRVGIGTLTPLSKTHILGDNTDNDLGQLLISGATSINKRLSVGFNTTDNYGFIQPLIAGDNYYNLVLNRYGGNVGIGTATPYGGYKLHIQGGDFAITNAELTNNFLINVSTSGTRVGSPNSLPVSINTANIDRLTVLADGNIGIGTTNPQQKLEVNGKGLFTGSTTAESATINIVADDPSLRFKTNAGVVDQNKYEFRAINNADNPDYRYFQLRKVNDANTVFTELFRVRNNGQIGAAAYGTGTITGTPTYLAAFDAAGNIIESPYTSPYLTFSPQTGTLYTLVLADAGKEVETDNAAANTVTIPPNSSVAFPVGTQIILFQKGAGQTSIVAGTGVTILSNGGKLKLTGQYSGATLIKRATDTWQLMGDIAA